MNFDIQLRKFLLSDLKSIVEIEKSSFTTDVYSKKKFENLYKKHSDNFIVAKISNKIIGYIIAHDGGGFVDFDSVAVDKKYRRLGVGRLLVNFMLNRFKQKSLKKASLEVRTTNKTAVSFYKNSGFKIARIIKNYYKDGKDVYRMEKKLI